MPIMDGIEACKCINARQVVLDDSVNSSNGDANGGSNSNASSTSSGSHPIAKVVFVTAHAMDSVEKECLQVGGIDFLPKPCSLSRVDDCFKRVFLGATKKG